jgi:hypothetical protein
MIMASKLAIPAINTVAETLKPNTVDVWFAKVREGARFYHMDARRSAVAAQCAGDNAAHQKYERIAMLLGEIANFTY